MSVEYLSIDNDMVCRQFTTWLHNAKPGEKYCYFTGKFVGGHPIARVAFKAYERGEILLVQSRETLTFNYWAIKRKFHYE